MYVRFTGVFNYSVSMFSL
jgi:hypothetical protein